MVRAIDRGHLLCTDSGVTASEGTVGLPVQAQPLGMAGDHLDNSGVCLCTPKCSQYSNMKGAALTQAQILAGKSLMCGHGFGCGCGFGYCHMLQVVGGGLGGGEMGGQTTWPLLMSYQ